MPPFGKLDGILAFAFCPLVGGPIGVGGWSPNAAGLFPAATIGALFCDGVLVAPEASAGGNKELVIEASTATVDLLKIGALL